MKITKMGVDLEIIAQMKEAERIAKLGCDKCPCCGEDKTFDYYWEHGVHNKGIKSTGASREKRKDKKLYEVEHYKCKNCEAEWESEPYEVLREW